MSFISIIIGLAVDRFVGSIENIRSMKWFDSYIRAVTNTRFGSLVNDGPIGIIMLLMPLNFAFFYIFNGLSSVGFLYGLVGILVFIYCLGPKSLNKQIDSYLEAWDSNDQKRAQEEASALMDGQASNDPKEQTEQVAQAAINAANDRIFSVIFWFLVGGPLGALIYRMASHAGNNAGDNAGLKKAASGLQALMGWLPGRLMAITFALTGSYDGVRAGYRSSNGGADLYETNYHVLAGAGIGALGTLATTDHTASVHAARGLIIRTLLVWLAVIAVFSLF